MVYGISASNSDTVAHTCDCTKNLKEFVESHCKIDAFRISLANCDHYEVGLPSKDDKLAYHQITIWR